MLATSVSMTVNMNLEWRYDTFTTLPDYAPGLGGLFVLESRRNNGIATALVRAGMNLAREESYKYVYTATNAASGILERLGWTLLEKVQHDHELLGLYYCDL